MDALICTKLEVIVDLNNVDYNGYVYYNEIQPSVAFHIEPSQLIRLGSQRTDLTKDHSFSPYAKFSEKLTFLTS